MSDVAANNFCWHSLVALLQKWHLYPVVLLVLTISSQFAFELYLPLMAIYNQRCPIVGLRYGRLSIHYQTVRNDEALFLLNLNLAKKRTGTASGKKRKTSQDIIQGTNTITRLVAKLRKQQKRSNRYKDKKYPWKVPVAGRCRRITITKFSMLLVFFPESWRFHVDRKTETRR